MRRVSLLALLAAACAGGGARSDLTLETDGAWVKTFAADRDTAYHAALAAFLADSWTIVRANPMGGDFTAKSEVRSTAVGLRYTLARVVVEPAPTSGTRVRLGLVATREPSGAGRRPNNDQPVRDRAEYERLFDAVARELAP